MGGTTHLHAYPCSGAAFWREFAFVLLDNARQSAHLRGWHPCPKRSATQACAEMKWIQSRREKGGGKTRRRSVFRVMIHRTLSRLPIRSEHERLRGQLVLKIRTGTAEAWNVREKLQCPFLCLCQRVVAWRCLRKTAGRK